MLSSKVKFILVVSKTNNIMLFKDNSKRQESAVVKVRIGKNVALHIEIIKK